MLDPQNTKTSTPAIGGTKTPGVAASRDQARRSREGGTYAEQAKALEPGPEHAPEPARDVEPPAAGVTLSVSDLADGFVSVVGEAVEFCAGRRGQETEIAVMARVPVEPPLAVAGGLTLQVAHTDEGYKVKCAPKVGLSVTDQKSAAADLLTGLSFETQGKTGEQAIRLLSLGLEREVRAMADEPPPAILSGAMVVALGPVLGQAMLVGDAANRMWNWITEGKPTSDLWPIVADLIWGGGYAESVFATMQKGEYVESVESGTFGGTIGSEKGPGGGMAMGAKGSIGVSQHRRVEQKGEGAEGVVETVRGMFDVNVEVAVSALTGKIDLSVPLSGKLEGGKGTFTLAAEHEGLSLGTYLTQATVRGLVAEIQRALSDDKARGPGIDEARRKLRKMQDISGSICSELQNAMIAPAMGDGLDAAKAGGEVVFELDFATGELKVTLSMYEKLEAGGLMAKAEGQRKQQLFSKTWKT